MLRLLLMQRRKRGSKPGKYQIYLWRTRCQSCQIQRWDSIRGEAVVLVFTLMLFQILKLIIWQHER